MPKDTDTTKTAGNAGVPENSPAEIKIQADNPAAVTADTAASTAAQPKTDTFSNVKTPASPQKSGVQSIFNEPTLEKKGSKVLESVLASKGSAANPKPILGKNAQLAESIQKERELKQKKNFRLAQTVFLSSFFIVVAIVGYFYIELSPSFDLLGPNTTARLTDMNRNLTSLQTQVNKYRYLMSQLDLNAFSLVSDTFLDETSKLALGTLESADDLNRSIEDLPAYLGNIRDNLSPNIVLPLYRSESEAEMTPEEITDSFESELKKAIAADLNRITESGQDLNDLTEQEIRLMENAMKLVGNSRLLALIQRSSPEDFKNQMNDYAKTLDPEKREELQQFIGGVLASTKSQVATISTLKNNRINWSSIIQDIEEVTVTVDKNFGRGVTRTLGEGILYTGYAFDTNTNTIVLSGLTLTNNAYNFTIISQLIEALEKDERFQNVEMRSFSKSGTAEQGYSANFKIDIQIENQTDSLTNKAISLQKTPVPRNTSAGNTAASTEAPPASAGSALASPSDSATTPSPSPSPSVPNSNADDAVSTQE